MFLKIFETKLSSAKARKYSKSNRGDSKMA
jgi:hypothetical protein